MISGSSFARTVRERRLATVQPGSRAQELISAGIDDLAKYRIMGLVYERPTMYGDAAHYATHLGFHSKEAATLELDELVGSGLLVKEEGSDDGLTRYRLAEDDPSLACLFGIDQYPASSSADREVIEVLADRSLIRARSVGQRNKRAG